MASASASSERTGQGSTQLAYADALLHLATLSIVAGAIHAVVAPPHFEEAWTYGALFCGLGAFQLAWGVWIYSRPSSVAFRIGAMVSLAVIVVWIVSRATGMPFGPEPWEPESIGALDLAATAAEALVAVLCAAFVAGASLRPDARWLPARVRGLHPVALAVMFAGLLSLLLGGGNHVH